MRQTVTTLALIAAGLLLAQPTTAAIKCWTNKDGVRECGNVVPPEYAQGRSTTVNTRGITTDVTERAKTKAELAAEQAREEEAKRLQREEDERRQKQETYDRVLLSTFTTEQEIIDSRDRKLTSIAATVEITNSSIGKLQETMAEHRRRAANLERAGKPIPDELKQDIANLQQQVDSKQAYIAGREQEMDEIKVQYGKDVLRFRELRGAGR